MERRNFIKWLSATGLSAYQPWSFAQSDTSALTVNDARYLVLVELQGGNDGLNTVVPFTNPQYYALRPRIALNKDKLHRLDESLGLHPAMTKLMPLWEKNQLAIVNGVGYPEPNRSHFRSIEIWETASDAEETRLNGWLEPLTSALPARNTLGVKAIALGNDEGPLAGSMADTLVFNNLRSFMKQAKALGNASAATGNHALDHVLQVQRATQRAANGFTQRLKLHSQQDLATAPKKSKRFHRQLHTVAQMIQYNLGPQVFKVSLGSFDTHANQASRHRDLLTQFSVAVADFQRVLQNAGLWHQVLIMTYSEFGRRAHENASKGTDHGTAAPQLLIGGNVKGGLYGKTPSLSNLSDGDMGFTTDFRRLYSTVAQDWFQLKLADSPLAGFRPLQMLSS